MFNENKTYETEAKAAAIFCVWEKSHGKIIQLHLIAPDIPGDKKLLRSKRKVKDTKTTQCLMADMRKKKSKRKSKGLSQPKLQASALLLQSSFLF